MSDSKGAAIDEIFDECGDWSGEPEQYYFDEETAKKKLKKLLAQEMNKARIDENKYWLEALDPDDPSDYFVSKPGLESRIKDLERLG